MFCWMPSEDSFSAVTSVQAPCTAQDVLCNPHSVITFPAASDPCLHSAKRHVGHNALGCSLRR